MHKPTLMFPNIPDTHLEYVLWEIKMKEWCDAVVEFETGESLTVTFVTPHRAAQEIEATPLPCYSMPRLMIVPDTTLETMEKAVQFAYECGVFELPNADK